MAAKLQDGWIVVDCNAAHSSRVQIQVGEGEPVFAFRGADVALVRPPAGMSGMPRVQLLVDDLVAFSGTLNGKE